MYIYILLLVLGFSSNIASTYTAFYSERLGKQAGTFITILLRDVLGIPVWVIGFVVAIGNNRETLFPTSAVSMVAAWVLIISGAVIVIASLLSIRLKAAAPSMDDKLVNTGLYAYMRHPVHLGTLLGFLGMFMLWPSFDVMISVLIGIAWLIIQSKAEEHDLLRRINGYRDYMAKVPGFFPSLMREK